MSVMDDVQKFLHGADRVVMFIMPRNVGQVPDAPRGHSAIFSRADMVLEWIDGEYHIVKSTAGQRPEFDEVTCKGSWFLRTACGKCSRCAEEAPRTIAHLLAINSINEERLAKVLAYLPPRPPFKGVDLVDTVKVSLFNALRDVFHGESK